MIQLSQPLSELEWIPRPKLTALRRLEIETVEDLLTHFPRRYEDRTTVRRISSRRKRDADFTLRRSREDTAAPLWPEKDFRGDA